MRTIIIGGVAGGMSAATRLRRLDESAEIIVFERGPYVSCANCGLPYYVGGIITDRSELLLQTPSSLHRRFRLDVRTGHEVVSIDTDLKLVTVIELATSTTSTEHYDTLILAVGAAARSDSTFGDIPTHTLRTVDDVDAITALLERDGGTRSALVIGGGFIGLEAAENLVGRGLHTTLIQRGPHILSPLDPEMTVPLESHLRAHGVDVHTSTVIENVTGTLVQLSDGTQQQPDLIIDASGVRPQTALALTAGVRLGPTGGIAVDDQNRTSDAHIFAVGDGVEKIDARTGKPALVTMAGLANRHGRTTADVIAGASDTNAPSLGTAIVAVFDMVAAKVGSSEAELRAAGMPVRAIHTHPTSHAGYYPGAEGMSMKLLVDPESDRILGAQIVGGAGVDKRIDIIAVAMTAGLEASALAKLELAYAPQFGSAKDPINQLGYVADNLRTGATRSVQWHELENARADGATLIDVRSAAEFAAGSIPGALNIPVDELRERLDELPDGPVVVHCQVGQRGHTAARILTQHGIDAVNLDGGFRTWAAGAEVREPAVEVI
ncbi:NADPH-dependent 2,4-dienoyl-CoA reductase/sulfur reductase-like enzyme/rhodanese-related sulfurtransferase [Microbacterium halimionae]|uniref:NADPH-dependent 2,4-dienoyl-CoA reductase/sulfur reductase-like enzyme/rhodanese-related sulfurtransferase n=1 Tax=Microbacterium halimionae TaxID=1526413 RepID=A0A7W3PMV7_9MICO|nr:FAD-dependent oxidoreductase [Microbacterium halimionae]MBA8817603.1 NADPH-dependent 2,4-dienoyl-CoA reductase/sulfur reductase-like enzyme/rhodanese-related sulfurtransferase [Microbacterium halimionae]NII94313.1 NADPH-dependent 2,4-dienoyl-CoA reductase/sulfur reductase-like enzyme/rhodanese-related sulfurtransferase [Microbacterium halimionae]